MTVTLVDFFFLIASKNINSFQIFETVVNFYVLPYVKSKQLVKII